MSTFNPVELVNELTPEQFELLLRAYVKKHIGNAPEKTQNLFLWGHSHSGWTLSWEVGVYNSRNDTTKTSGEVLAWCVLEASRREQADNANKLLLIESAAEEMPIPAPKGWDEVDTSI